MASAKPIDRPTPTTMAGVPGRDPTLAGRRAECDGGSAIPGTRLAGRGEFAGQLTGEYFDHGDPAWRWYRLAGLTRKPPGYPADSVWCESESLFLIDAAGRTLLDAPLPSPMRRKED